MAEVRTCECDGCERLHYAHGLCRMHYDRRRRNGEVGESASRRFPAKGQTCSVLGCDEPVVAKGVCNTHRLRRAKYGSDELPQRPVHVCSVADCNRGVKAKGLCAKHYLHHWAGNDPTESRRYGQTSCKYPGCPLPHSWDGYCKVHAMQLYSYGEVGEPRQRRYRDDEECVMPGCTKRPESAGLCMSHYVTLVSAPKRGRRMEHAAGNATPEQVKARVEYYGELCNLCGKPWEAIDHYKPLSKDGSNWPANLRPVCKSCNSQKGDKWPFHQSMLNSRGLGAS
jgi:5-methylcytosine-specific restriction endonuclease McrA